MDEEKDNERLRELHTLFLGVDESQKSLVRNLLEEMVFLEQRIKELKKLPFIRVHPTNNAKQEPTTAARQYNDLSAGYRNTINILLKLLGSTSDNEDDDPVKRFQELQQEKMAKYG